MRNDHEIYASADPAYVFTRLVVRIELVSQSGRGREVDGYVLHGTTGQPGLNPYSVGSLATVALMLRLQETFGSWTLACNVANCVTAPARWAATSRKAVARV